MEKKKEYKKGNKTKVTLEELNNILSLLFTFKTAIPYN